MKIFTIRAKLLLLGFLVLATVTINTPTNALISGDCNASCVTLDDKLPGCLLNSGDRRSFCVVYDDPNTGAPKMFCARIC